MNAVRAILLAVLGLLSLATARPVAAHEVRPALLQVTETKSGQYELLWKQPTMGEVAVRLVPHLSSGWLEAEPVDQYASPGFLIKTWRVTSKTPLDGQTLGIEGLDRTITDVLVRVTLANGRRLDAMVKPDRPRLTLSLSGRQALDTPAYLRLGVEHILAGFDHLLFVLGLLLLAGMNWRIVKAVTAFTVAHSITLSLAALGFVRFPSAVIEALVALSIVFVAAELLRSPDRPRTLTRRHPWIIAFTFGLLHGLAFAGALADIGLPVGAVPMALLMFNVGVEIGQLMFIAAALAVILLLRWARARAPLDLAPLARLGPAYGIGAFAMFWFFERLAIAFTRA